MSIIAPWYQLGYVIPHLYTDLDAYQFYRIAPEGMMVVTTGLNLREYSLAAVEENLPMLWDRFELLAKKKVNRLSLSGVPVASALGRKRMRAILAEAEKKGVKVFLPTDTRTVTPSVVSASGKNAPIMPALTIRHLATPGRDRRPAFAPARGSGRDVGRHR